MLDGNIKDMLTCQSMLVKLAVFVFPVAYIRWFQFSTLGIYPNLFRQSVCWLRSVCVVFEQTVSSMIHPQIQKAHWHRVGSERHCANADRMWRKILPTPPLWENYSQSGAWTTVMKTCLSSTYQSMHGTCLFCKPPLLVPSLLLFLSAFISFLLSFFKTKNGVSPYFASVRIYTAAHCPLAFISHQYTIT